MVSFELTDEQKQFQSLAREFTKNEIIPVAEHYDKLEQYPAEVVQKAYDVGLLNVIIPENLGGLGLGVLDEVILAEEMGYGCMGIYTILMASELGITPIVIAGTEEQKERFLKPMLDKPSLSAFALTEAGSGSDASRTSTRAVFDGDDVIINGSKMWISNGGIANFTIVFANHDPELKHRGLVAVVVPKDVEGFSYNKITGKMGQRATQTSELIFENVRVPKANILGDINDGFKIAMRTLDKTRVPVAGASVGVARRAVDEANRYANEREAFGGKLNQLQAIQFKLADMKIGLETARWQAYYAAWCCDQGKPSSSASSIAKAYGSDTAFQVANEALHVLGGYGYVNEYPIEKLLRDVKLNQIYEGTNEIQRLVIARKLIDEVN